MVYAILNEAIGSSGKKSSSIDKIEINGIHVHDKTDISNNFNDYFSSIGKKIQDKVLPTDKPPDDFFGNPSMNSIFLQPCHIDEIIEIISELQNKDSLDIDEISTSLLKFVSQQICTPLVHIFNL